MKISIKETKAKTVFGQLDVGDVFLYKSSLWLKTPFNTPSAFAVGSKFTTQVPDHQEVQKVISIQAEV